MSDNRAGKLNLFCFLSSNNVVIYHLYEFLLEKELFKNEWNR